MTGHSIRRGGGGNVEANVDTFYGLNLDLFKQNSEYLGGYWGLRWLPRCIYVEGRETVARPSRRFMAILSFDII
jgi:hypothetical protein